MLLSIWSVAFVSVLQKAGSDPSEFHLVTKDRTWVFRGVSKEDKRKWIDVLEACIKGE